MYTEKNRHRHMGRLGRTGLKAVMVGFVCALGLPLTQAAAQENAGTATGVTVNEIVVTALRREQRLLDAPLAISAFSEVQLENIGAVNFVDVSRFIPGLEFQNQNDGAARITIRGVSSLSGSSATVGVYIDEIPITSPFDQTDLLAFDVNRIEVLRGPQGTLYGEASMGGTIRVITNQPDSENFAGKVDLSVSDTKGGEIGWRALGMVNIPIVEDRLALRVSGNYQDEAGYIDGVTLGDDINSVEKYGGRVSLRWDVTEDFVATANVIYQKIESGSSSQSDRNYDTVARLLSPVEEEDILINLTLNFDLGWAELISATGYYDRDRFRNQDITDIAPGLLFLFNQTCPLPFVCEFPMGINTINFIFDRVEENWTQEVRLVSAHEGPIQWTAGFYFKDSEITDGVVGITDPLAASGFDSLFIDSTNDVRQIAGYGELTWDLTEQLSITGGIRYFNEKRDNISEVSGLPSVFVGVTSLDDSSKENVWTPKFNVSYKPTDDVLLFATAARGFRSGGINPSAQFINLINGAFMVPVPPAQSIFVPDTLWSYEFGWKTQWFDDRLTFEGAIFYIDWKDVQVAGNAGAAPLGFTLNGGDARSRGVEVSIFAQPVEGLQLGFSNTYTDAETREDVPEAPAGARLPQVPKWKTSATAQYSQPIAANLTGTIWAGWSRVGERVESLSATNIFPSYHELDIRLGVEQENWQFYVFGTNITNEAGVITDGSSFDEFYLIRPRELGVNFRVQF